MSPFHSFWMGGFECTDQLNAFGHRVDFLNLTRHGECIDHDYRNLELLKIRTVREGIRWSQVERTPYDYDWTTVERMMDSARSHGVQQIWDLCHFGYPDDLTPLHPMFARRFAALCRAFARLFRSIDDSSPMIVTPINEVSFLSWLGGDVRGTAPYCVGQGWEVKYRLMKAYIEGVEALKEVDAGVRILTTEPLVNITHSVGARRMERAEARRHHMDQFQVIDILGGRMCPELRGRPEYLDLLGFNFYYNNQWVKATNEMLDWRNEATDPRWVPLHRMLKVAHKRYGRPVVLSETSHPKEDRPRWMDMIARECAKTIEAGVPLLGVCWYPVIDRPDWDNPQIWHEAGLWDRSLAASDGYERVLHRPTAAAFLRAQLSVPGRMNRCTSKTRFMRLASSVAR
jgi:beta-glucosidase/6-phospho-beta-glucosidase/beta-galactosidase